MQTSEKGFNVIRSFEGRALRAYQDSGGVWTIGYGSTNFDVYAVSQFGKIKKGLTITPEQAEAVFVHSIKNGYEPAVRKRLNPLAGCTQATFDAGVSFHYNTGKIASATWPTALINGRKDLARTSILSWNKDNGRVLAGLTRRRAREWAMIDKGDYGPEGAGQAMDLDTKKPVVSTVPPTPEASGSRVPGLLQLGDSGDEVKDLNAKLAALGRLPDVYGGLSVFGTATEAAVKKYQGSHPNLTVDGKVGPATSSSLIRDINMRQSSAKTVKATSLIGVVGTAAAAAGLMALKTALIAAGVVGSVGLIYLVIKHRTELETLWNTLLRKRVS